ncbi:MAG: hypothetical protein JRC89_05375 [Deltaproteobacteria bacterium]|nr:hypothetical protein [Deltaproteobacteria bacterium]
MGSLKEKRKACGCRAFASLNCVHYPECLDQASKKNIRMQCHKCDRMKVERDNYRKEVGAHSINNHDPGGHTIRVDYSNERY